MESPIDFCAVLKQEQCEMRHLRCNRSFKCASTDYVGLALSGGGIRSATFNLGVLQALAEKGFLKGVDYLSTVSGGGYIGSWLIAWLKRESFEIVEKWLKPSWKDHPHSEKKHPQPAPAIEFLRDYSNYLTPQVGFLTVDTWTAIAIFMRNLLLNLTILVLASVSILLIPHLLCYLAGYSGAGLRSLVISQELLAIGYGVFLNYFWAAANDASGTNARRSTQGQILLGICPLWVGGVYLEVCCYSASPSIFAKVIGNDGLWSSPAARAIGFWLALWFLLGLNLAGRAVRRDYSVSPSWQPIAIALSSVSYLVLCFFSTTWALSRLANSWPGKGFALTVLGVPIVILVYLLAGVLQVGLSGLLLKNQAREFTARMNGWVMIFCILWTTLFTISIYGPFAILRMSSWVSGSLTLAWVAHTVGGVWSAFTSRSGNQRASNWIDWIATWAAPAFALGLLTLLSLGIYRVGAELPGSSTPAAPSPTQVTIQAQSSGGTSTVTITPPAKEISKISLTEYAAEVQGGRLWGAKWTMGLVSIAFLLLAVLLSLRVDINEFAMNTLYRNRLVRCYLGASRPSDDGDNPCRRRPDSFSGFDPQDDLLLKDLCWDATSTKCQPGYAGPYPIINATLNLTHGRRLAWQERKAESFTFTPLYCGGTLNDCTRYLPTKEYAYPPSGVYLGTAMAISGAALSPLVGFHYSAGAGFLLTVFNVRLGQWMANPRSYGTLNRTGPRLGLFWLFKELLGLMDDQAPYVYLSDGGHFENLGIYELVRRKVRYIIASDADADPDMTFGDLANAIRKCQSDFGATIDIKLEALRPETTADHSQRFSHSHHALGEITYADGSKGHLLYIKASLTRNDPADVLEFRSEDPAFPHTTTADQWFTESDFESYRQLGCYAAGKACSTLVGRKEYQDLLDRL